MHGSIPLIPALALAAQLATSLATDFLGPSYEDLPSHAIFPGPWDDLIQAPKNKSHILPKRVFRSGGDVGNAELLLEESNSKQSMTLGPSGIVTFEFPQNVAGR